MKEMEIANNSENGNSVNLNIKKDLVKSESNNRSNIFMDKSYPNIINGELEDSINEIMGTEKGFLILSSLGYIVNGFYSNPLPNVLTYNPTVNFQGKEYWAENIAGDIQKHHSAELEKFSPMTLFTADLSDDYQNINLHLFIASNISYSKKVEISELIDDAWENNHHYKLNLQSNTN